MMKPETLLLGTALALAAGTLAPARAAAPDASFPPLSVELPAPGGAFTGTDADILNQNCMACHSAGFVNRQPKLPAATWTAEVEKMKNVFGAPYATSTIPEIVKALEARQDARK